MGGLDRVLEHPTVRHFLLGFEEKEWTAALESAAVLGIHAMTARYGRGVRLAHISCLKSLAQYVERKGGWPVSIIELKGKGCEEDDEPVKSSRKKKSSRTGKSVPPTTSRCKTMVRQANGELPSASQVAKLRRRRSAPPAQLAELGLGSARPGAKAQAQSGALISPGLRVAAASGRPGASHFAARQRSRDRSGSNPPAHAASGLRSLLGSTASRSRGRSRSASAERRTVRMPTAPALVSKETLASALSGASDSEAPLLQQADGATAEWYSRLMMRLKRLDSQKGKDGLRVMGEAAYLGSSAMQTSAPVSSRTTTTGGFLDVSSSTHADRGLGSEGLGLSARTTLTTPPHSARQRRGVSYGGDGGGGSLRQSLEAASEGDDAFAAAARMDALAQECAASEALLESTTASFGARGGDNFSARATPVASDAGPLRLGRRSQGAIGRVNESLQEIEAATYLVSDLPARQERRDRRARGLLEGRGADCDEDFLDLTQEALGVSLLD
eukprot:TRINITY_DN81869_c0_g1_i1.p1 TRINITY_DN81869_c0_g1~~TRINITY_DN81869_c0_g1_i1.p1  ORF type:complete len:501 (+),score=112.74 TRINITY_DN81869_c0_g1_i1:82-1584(+)